MKKIKLHLILILASTALVLACSNSKEAAQTNESKSTEHPSETPELPVQEATLGSDSIFRKQITQVFDAYISVKDALIESNVETVRSAITQLRPALQAVDAKHLEGAAVSDWKLYSDAALKSLDNLEQAGDLEAQRSAFSPLSNELYKIVKTFGLAGRETYYTYCPMALKNKGAYWLSKESEIRNPYFGASMLNCGSVRERRH